MKDYIPYPFFHNDAPIDISFIFEDEKPAGKHGFLGIKGRKFVFEDGTEMKFWGTNFNGAGCFPEHSYSEIVARRLAKFGINIVRFHQMDCEWHTPNIFYPTKGKRMSESHLNPDSMDKLDYLIYCLKKEGIYVYMDMLTYRKFRSDEGVDNAHLLGDSAKPYSIFAKKLIELQKEFNEALWTNYNPYTYLRYCDDPVIILTEITNENDLFHTKWTQNGYVEPYKTEFDGYFNEWLKEKGIDRKAEDFDVNDVADRDLLDFKTELQRRYYKEMMEHLRSVGVKIPIAGTNWPRTPDNDRSQLVCDFLDTHRYLYGWTWKEFEKRCANVSVTHNRTSYLDKSGYQTNVKLPTYVSEWDVPWPNEFRADSVLYTAALGCFQGWSGFAIHTYSYSTKLHNIDLLGEEISAPMIANVPYRQGVFATWNDPAKFGLFYHAALITRRGDVKEGKKTYGVDLEGLCKYEPRQIGSLIDKHKFVTTFGNIEGLELLPAETNEGSVTSDTGELFRSWEKNYGTIDTPMTKCAYGFLCKNGEIALNGLKVKCDTDFAVIAMSSLTKDPITKSNNILLTTVGRAKNTDAKFSEDLMLDIGHAPITVENIKAELELETDQTGLVVWSISAEGYYIGKQPVEYSNGKMKIKLGDTGRSMYYLIVKD